MKHAAPVLILAVLFTSCVAEKKTVRAENFIGNYLVSVTVTSESATRVRERLGVLSYGGGIPSVEILLDTIPPISGVSTVNASSSGGDRLWLMIRPESTHKQPMTYGNAWDQAHAMVDNPAKNLVPLLSAENRDVIAPILSNSSNILTIEPDVSIWDVKLEKLYMDLEENSLSNVVKADMQGRSDGCQISRDPSPAWPAPDAVDWHAVYSKIKEARSKAEKEFSKVDKTKNVLIYHLDTGYYKHGDSIRPHFLDIDLSRSVLESDRSRADLPEGFDRFEEGFLFSPGHGTSTLSVLAGNRIKSGNIDDYLGGVPYARIASCRIGKSVLHIWTGAMVKAMDMAIKNNADLITMAAGSPPSEALVDAVNNAYDKGIAMIFASGDYVQSPLPFIRTPHTTVYPARFNRALSVAGLTSEGTSYSLPWRFWYWLRPGYFADMSLRGSYGPDSVMEHTLSAYTPNVTAQLGKKDDTPNLLKRDFAGTSAATPQVAAAAALWLQTHRNDPILNEPWKRAEGVYQGLFISAEKKSGCGSDRLGHGALNAIKALEMKPEQLSLNHREPSTIGFNWLKLVSWICGESPADSICDVKRAAHGRMLRVEAAQLFQSSSKLKKILSNYDGKEPKPETQREFLEALKEDSRASEFLIKHVGIFKLGVSE